MRFHRRNSVEISNMENSLPYKARKKNFLALRARLISGAFRALRLLRRLVPGKPRRSYLALYSTLRVFIQVPLYALDDKPL